MTSVTTYYCLLWPWCISWCKITVLCKTSMTDDGLMRRRVVSKGQGQVNINVFCCCLYPPNYKLIVTKTEEWFIKRFSLHLFLVFYNALALTCWFWPDTNVCIYSMWLLLEFNDAALLFTALWRQKWCKLYRTSAQMVGARGRICTFSCHLGALLN